MNDDSNLNSVEDTESPPSFDFAARKRRILILLLTYSAILGIIFCFVPEEDTPLDFILGLPLLILAISWCFTDAAEHEHRIGRFMKLLLILLFIIGLPIYLFQTRGVGAIKTLALAMVLVGAMCGCMFITAYATLYVGEVAGFWKIVD